MVKELCSQQFEYCDFSTHIYSSNLAVSGFSFFKILLDSSLEIILTAMKELKQCVLHVHLNKKTQTILHNLLPTIFYCILLCAFNKIKFSMNQINEFVWLKFRTQINTNTHLIGLSAVIHQYHPLLWKKNDRLLNLQLFW